MARVVLLTGGNTGDVKRTLQAAQQLINARVAPCCVVRTVTKASRGASMPNSISRTRRLRSPPTCNRSRCLRPCRPSSRNWAATARPKRSRKPYGRGLHLAADRHRHPLLRRRGDRKRAAHRSPPAPFRAGIRLGPAVRNHAPAPPPGHGADHGGDVQGPAPE